MKHLELTRDYDGVSDDRRKDTDNLILRKAKIKMIAYKGGFDRYCNPREIADAKNGFCPKKFEVHHIIPLNCMNTSFQLDNMVVIERNAHTWLHRNIYTPALEKCLPGQFCYILMPDIDPSKILTWNDIYPFVVSFDRNERLYKTNRKGGYFSL